MSTEAEIVARFNAAHKALDEAEKAVEAHFMPRLRAAIVKKDEKAAREIVHAIPSDCVTKCFGLDALRQAWPKKTS